MTKKQWVIRIVLPVVAAILIAVMCVANYFLNYYSLIIHRFMVGDTADASSGESADALTAADELVQDVAGESMVLLKNDNGFLPKKDLKKVNLFGYGSTDKGFLLTGGGSGGTSVLDVDAKGKPRIKVDLTDAFTAANIEYNKELSNAYAAVSSFDADWREGGTTNAYAADSLINPSASFYTAERMKQAKDYSDIAIVTLSRFGAENEDMSSGGELKNMTYSDKSTAYTDGDFLRLTKEERAMLDSLKSNGFSVVVLLNTCNNMELGFLDEYDNIKACLYVGIPGQSGAKAIPDILTGKIDPSGKTSDIFPYSHAEHNPVYVNTTKIGSDLTYQEGIYFGYKWYETADASGYFTEHETTYEKVVQFPFGYGLSYTDFTRKVVDWGITGINADTEYTVKVRVTNIGNEPGREVVQLYGHAPYTEGKIEKAERVLLDFAKTPMLYPASVADKDKPNEAVVELKFKAYDLASYDVYDKNGNKFSGYELDAGDYTFYVMTDSHNVAVDPDGNNLEKTIRLASGIKYERDPDTNAEVVNRFTGATAYAGCPIDGENVFDAKVDYLSRADKFKNFPTAPAGSAVASKVNKYTNYRYTGYDNTDTSAYVYGAGLGLTIAGVEAENGSTLPATREQLNGEDTTIALKYNKEIMELLCEYDNDGVWDVFLGQLTKEEISSLIGEGGFQTVELVSVGKPRCTDKDGPAGFNNNVTTQGKAAQYTVWPSESLIGCSWDKELAYKIGEAQAKIASAMVIQGWYGPGVNLHRSAYNARNYEYYSEDATLSGKLAANTIAGAKKNNLYCYLKHFAVSEAGVNPKNWNTWLTEQTLRESYLKAFEIALKESDGNGVMSAFNRVGATLAGYNHALLTDVLRNEWDFKGTVITDWYEGKGYMENHTLGVLAGNDLWLCGSTSQPADLDLSKPEVAFAARRAAKNILYTYVVTNFTSESIKVAKEAHSSLFITLWVLLNVVLGLGIAACLTFFVLNFFGLPRPRKPKTSAAGSAPSGEQAQIQAPNADNAESGESAENMQTAADDVEQIALAGEVQTDRTEQASKNATEAEKTEATETPEPADSTAKSTETEQTEPEQTDKEETETAASVEPEASAEAQSADSAEQAATEKLEEKRENTEQAAVVSESAEQEQAKETKPAATRKPRAKKDPTVTIAKKPATTKTGASGKSGAQSKSGTAKKPVTSKKTEPENK